MGQATITVGKKGTFSLMVMLCFAIICSLLGSQMNAAKVYADVSFSGGDGSRENPFIVNTPEQLDAIRYGTSQHYKLGNDIDVTAYLAQDGGGYNGGAFWAPIPNFSGTFDGDGYVFKGVKMNRPQMQFAGFFGNTGPGATIKNIGLENVDVVSGLFVGALVGGLQGSGATVSNSYVTGSVAGSIYIGGLVGYQADSSISNSYSSARVTGTNSVGGLVGYQDRSSIANSYVTGLVTGGNNIGGLVGISPTGEAISSFYDQTITSENNSGKGTPASTIEMHTQSTFGDWDFSSVWYMPPNQYLQLRAFLVKSPVANPDPADGPVVWGSSVAITSGTAGASIYYTTNGDDPTTSSTTWSSSDPKVATVDEKGVVTPIAAGTATITVTTTDQAKTATSQVKVVEATKLVGLEVSEKTISLKPNKSSSITVQAIYSDGTKENITKNEEVTYLSSSRSIVTVTKGVIKAGKKEGQATITITYRDKQVEVPVWISKLDVTKLEIQPANIQVEVDQVEQLKLTATLSNKKTQDVTEQAIWESSEPTVATIDESGKLTAMASGTTVITAAYGGKTTEITVEVNEAKQIKRLSASKQKVTVGVGKEQSIKLTATYKDHSKKIITNQAIWSSEDETIATVKNGVIIGQAKGMVKIHAKYQGKSVTISVTVTE